MHKLDGAVAKLNRAGEQTVQLDNLIRTAIEGRSYRVVIAERERNSSYRTLRLAPGEVLDTPLAWSAIIGEIAHDLRSSLDLLACELALLKSGSTDILDVSFPIRLYGPHARPGKHKPRWNSGLVRFFKRHHGARIKQLQPYHRGQRVSLLWLLQELNNADKHRSIQTVAVSTERISPSTVRMSRDPDDVHDTVFVKDIVAKQRVPLKGRAKVGWVNVTMSPKAKVDMDFRVAPKVVFADGCEAVRGAPVIFLLAEMTEAVLKTLHLFGSEFR